MKHITAYIRYALLYVIIAMFFACQQPGGNSTGSEYMPDMGHSVAYEANYYNYYYQNTWGSKDDYYKMVQPREPVAGTIARGYAGGTHVSDNDVLAFAPNGSVPYYYGDSDEERLRASEEIIQNPYHITDAGLAQGKELYEIFCAICHGDKGDGVGYLVRENGGKYPVQPANLLLPEFVSASNGQYYHAMMYGKNKMGAYKDKLSYEERWQVIHYVRSLQAKELKLEYSQLVNTLTTGATPAGEIVVRAVEETGGHSHSDGSEHDAHDEGEHHTDDQDHSDEGHH